jgi:hypothetical protein
MICMDRAKPFCIAKRDVWEAYRQVKANRGAAGVDGQSLADFDENLRKKRRIFIESGIGCAREAISRRL